MKKFLAILVTICVLAGALCVTAFAALLETLDAVPVGTVLRLSALKRGEDAPVVLSDHTDFKDGWNTAMKIAGDSDEMRKKGYDRIVVDLYTDWIADKQDMFSDDFIDGDGFKSDTIYIPEGAKVTLNLNGHTIDRHLEHMRSDGEVIVIDYDADVIINNGTIKGGYGDTNDAGAIYIDGNAGVTLNNVNIADNITTYDGGGIYVGSGSILTVNGGSFKNNRAIIGGRFWNSCGGAVCVEGGTAFFNGVEFTENIAPSDDGYGAAVYVEDGGKVVIENCTFNRNGIQTADRLAAKTVIHGDESSITITNSTFTDNAGENLFYVEDSNLIITGGKITKTVGTNVFYLEDTEADIEGVTITDNACGVMTLENSNELVNMIGCTLGNNTPTETEAAFVIDEPGTLILLDCILGNTTFSDKEYVKITTSEVTREEAVIGIELLREDGTVDSVRYYKDFASGWGYATESAKTGFFGRVAVSLYADWNTYEFGAVSIPENARMTLNLNGHKIDRATQGKNWNGEVLYVSANADVIINDGTITGGNSRTGASGIHINDNAKVVLNDVNVDDNHARGGTNGAAIAVYNGATLVMNGGSLSDNFMDKDTIPLVFIPLYPYGTLYVEDATATLNNVTISNNTAGDAEVEGAAIYADSSTVTLNDCVVSGNINAESDYYAESVIGAEDSTLIINNTDFTDNGKVSDTDDIDYCSLFDLVDCKLTMNGGKITDNHADKIFYLDDTEADIKGVTITGNASIILDIDNSSAKKVTLTECTLGNNEPVKEEFDVFVDMKGTLNLSNCELGDTTFKNKKMVDFGNGAGAGSIFGEGSFSMIVSLVALIASGISILLIVDMKKKLVPATANNTEENEDEE